MAAAVFMERTRGSLRTHQPYCPVNLHHSCCRHYHGVAVLMERIRRGNTRLGLSKADPADLDRGYIVKYDNDNIDPGDTTFALVVSGLTMVLEYPSGSKTPQHVLFIQEYALLPGCALRLHSRSTPNS